MELVEALHARRCGGSRSPSCARRRVADEVVQESWLGVLRGLDRFEGRSSLKTWIFRIVANIARTRAEREARSVPVLVVRGDDDEPSVDPSRFLADGALGDAAVEPWQRACSTPRRGRVIDARDRGAAASSSAR